MIILKVFLAAVCGCIILLLLKNTGSPYILLVQSALIVLVFLTVSPQFKELLGLIESFGIYESIGEGSFLTLMKVFALLFTGAVVSDILRDNGENALGGVVEFCVKTAGVVAAIPVLSAVISIALGFVGS